jgi:hypothetical protein
MEEARAVLARLERIEALEREGAGVKPLLAELRELVREATEWAERERDPKACEAAAALRDSHEALLPSRPPWPSPQSSDSASYSYRR